MKKSTKILITVGVVAAVVGAGAVTYAAWTSDNTSKTVSGTTGSIRTIGNMTVTPTDASGTVDGTTITMNQLFPVDQGKDYLTYWEFTLSAEVSDNNPIFKLAGELSSGSWEGAPSVNNAALYWSAEKPTNEEGEVVVDIDEENKLSATAVTLENLTDDTVYVYLVATGTDAMNANITLTFSCS